MESPKIYVADLAAYNEGKLVGEWLDLSDYNDGDEVMDAINDLLQEWSEGGEEREEFAIHDYEGFPKEYYSEYMGKEDFDKVIKIIKLSEANDIPFNILVEYADEAGVDLTEMRDIPFSGRFDSDEDFAYDLVEQGVITDLSNYLEMYPTDMRIFAQEEADARLENSDDEDLLSDAGLLDDVKQLEEDKDDLEKIDENINDLEFEIDQLYDNDNVETESDIEEIDAKVEELRSEMRSLESDKDDLERKIAGYDFRNRYDAISKAMEILRDDVYDEIYKELQKDAVGYFVDNFEYEEKDLIGKGFHVDYKALVRNLSYDYTFIYDGEEVYVFNNNYAKGGKIDIEVQKVNAEEYADGGEIKIKVKLPPKSVYHELLYYVYYWDGYYLEDLRKEKDIERAEIGEQLQKRPKFLYLTKKELHRYIVLLNDGYSIISDEFEEDRRVNKRGEKIIRTYLAYLNGLYKEFSSGGKLAHGGLIASSQTKDGIEKIISEYYYSPNIKLNKVGDTDVYEVSNAKGKIDGVKVVLSKGRYRFMKDSKMEKGGITGDVHDLTNELLSQKIQIFLDKVEPIEYYYVDEETNSLIVGFDGNFTQKDADKFAKEASSSMEFFDADSVDMKYLSQKDVTEYKIKLKKNVKFENGGGIDDDVDAFEEDKKKIENLTKSIETIDEDGDGDEISLPKSISRVYQYDVPKETLQAAIESIKKLSKKFKVQEPKIEIGEERRVGIDYDYVWGEFSYYVYLIPVKIYVDEIFKLYDYSVVGVVDNFTGGVVNFGDEIVPEEYREPNNVCDLCNTKRNRGKTWIVKKTDTGEYLRFGSDCVQRVYGINPAKFLKAVDYFNKLKEIIAVEEEAGGGGSGRRISPLMRYVPFNIALSVCKSVYDTHGYIKKKWAEDDSSYYSRRYRTNEGQATADIALNLMENMDYMHKQVPNDEFINDFKLYWLSLDIKNTEGFNNFLKNIQNSVAESQFQLKDIGLYVYAIHYYTTKKDDVKLESEYVGRVGEKIPLQNLKITLKKGIETQYGYSNLWKLIDESGNTFTKFGEISSQYFVKNETGYNPLDDYESLKSYTLQEGDFVTFIAEIKAHQEYQGKKSTQLGRVSAYKPKNENKGSNLSDGGQIPKVYEKVIVTIRDVDMGGDIVYKNEHWFLRSALDKKSSTDIGEYILRKYGLDYGNTYKYSIKKTGETKERYAEGGKTTFKRKVKSISESLLERKDVPKKLQKDYGETYNRKEAVQAAKRIAGAMRKKELAKKKK